MATNLLGTGHGALPARESRGQWGRWERKNKFFPMQGCDNKLDFQREEHVLI